MGGNIIVSLSPRGIRKEKKKGGGGGAFLVTFRDTREDKSDLNDRVESLFYTSKIIKTQRLKYKT